MRTDRELLVYFFSCYTSHRPCLISSGAAYVVNFIQKIATVIEEEGLQSGDPKAFKVGKVLDEAVDRLIALAKKKKKD